MDEVVKVVMQHDVLWQHVSGDVHVGIILCIHGGSKTKVFQVTHHAFGIGHGEDTVEQDFGHCEICHFGAYITIVMDAVIPNGLADAMQSFFWPVCTDNAQVCGLDTSGHLVDQDEMDSVSARDCGSTLGKVVDLGSVGGTPKVAVTAMAELIVFCKLASVQVEGIAM